MTSLMTTPPLGHALTIRSIMARFLENTYKANGFSNVSDWMIAMASYQSLRQ